MPRRNTPASVHNCLIGRALEELGDRWVLLIVRELMFGPRRFNAIQESLGIARNLLAERLRRLEAFGILERVGIEGEPHRHAYALTEKGGDLQMIMLALAQWGTRWHCDEAGPTTEMVDKTTGSPIAPLEARTEAGAPVARDAVAVRATACAHPEMKARFAEPIVLGAGASCGTKSEH